jgi:hypothetical protein
MTKRITIHVKAKSYLFSLIYYPPIPEAEILKIKAGSSSYFMVSPIQALAYDDSVCDISTEFRQKADSRPAVMHKTNYPGEVWIDTTNLFPGVYSVELEILDTSRPEAEELVVMTKMITIKVEDSGFMTFQIFVFLVVCATVLRFIAH